MSNYRLEIEPRRRLFRGDRKKTNEIQVLVRRLWKGHSRLNKKVEEGESLVTAAESTARPAGADVSTAKIADLRDLDPQGLHDSTTC
jgi:hypothetical protein